MNPNTFVEMYSYTQGGLMAGNELLISQTAYQPPGYTSPVVTADLEATYTYDNEGKMTGMHYPSSGSGGFQGDTYAYSFDSMARPTGLTDQTNTHTAVSGVTYGPAGEMLTIGYGLQGNNWFSETRTYNTLLQVTAISATNSNTGAQFGRQYSYSANSNNGKIQSETDTISGEQVTYQYDALNRLQEALSNSASAPWGQSFTYDQFGNLTDKEIPPDAPPGSMAPLYHAAFDAATNREHGASYDANGNRLAIPQITLGYDVENRIVTANPTGTEEVYSYGRGNRRVYAAHWQWDGTKFNLTSEKIYFYSVTGQKLATYQLSLYDPQPGTPSLNLTALDTRVWFGSRLVTLNGLPVVPDRLGSFGKYYPYGEERGTGNPPGDQEKFATYTRDSATGLDYAVNRYYNSVGGRFLTADPYLANNGGAGDPTDPGSWNRYAYVGSDPTNFTDPSGLARCGATITENGVVTYENYYDCPESGGEDADGVAQFARPANSFVDPNQTATHIALWTKATMARLSVAIATAELALNDPHCASLFDIGGDGPDPKTLLAEIASGLYGKAYFTVDKMDPSGNVATNAVTHYTSYAMGPDGGVISTGVADKVVTAFNWSPQAPFNNATVQDNAVTVLHELGHIYDFLFGQGSTLLVNDSTEEQGSRSQATAASEFNTKLVQANCFK